MLEKVVFKGNIRNENNDVYPALVSLEYDKYDPRVLRCNLGLENVPDKPDILFDRQFNPKIFGHLATGEEICITYGAISYKQYFQSKHWDIELDVETVSYGSFGVVPFSSGKYWLRIYLIDAPSVHVDYCETESYLGDISMKRNPDDGIFIKSGPGDLIISNYYRYEKTDVGIEKARLQIVGTEIRIQRDFDKPVKSEDVISEAESEIEDILSLLSFINRRFIEWYEIITDFIPIQGSAIKLTKKRKISRFTGFSRHPLFHHKVLKNGLLGELVLQYKSSTIKETIKRTITSLIASYEMDNIASSLQAAYSAIDAIANELSKKHHIMKFPKSKKKRPISNRIVDLFKFYGIEYWDFKDYDISIFATMIDKIFTRRNDAIHEAKIDLSQSYADLVRLRALCERLILAELGFKDYNKLFIVAYSELSSISKL